MEVKRDMGEVKKQWETPTVTKVKLEFDKEMTNNCHGSSNPSKNHPCGPHGAGNCWGQKHNNK